MWVLRVQYTGFRSFNRATILAGLLFFTGFCTGMNIPVRADRIVMKDGRELSSVWIYWENGLQLRQPNGSSIPLEWDDLEKVDYRFPLKSENFPEKWRKYHQNFSSLPLENIIEEGWDAVNTSASGLAELDEKNFLENRLQSDYVPPLVDALLPEFNERIEQCFEEGRIREAAELAAIIIQAGYHCLKSPVPERVFSGRKAIDEALEVFSRIVQTRVNPDERDWNIIFLTNRLYESWRRNTPQALYFNPDLYLTQLEEKTNYQSPAAMQFPENFRSLAEAYIRQVYLWTDATSSPDVRQVYSRRQKELAEAWVRSFRPGLEPEQLNGRNRFQEDWKVLRARMEITYLTAESLYFKRLRKRLDPRTQTNIPPLTDPFSVGFYQYNRGEQIDQIYSIGPDRKDQEGSILYELDSTQKTGDIFILRAE
jgi:hypothetical protein